ncbi:unnamed protein product [marine sediment metagenome]|uniref:Uncharacterized protein n=1 Tax=marine sediment metagenome TaxID=412755 RepID=X0W610_9ZZZZ
MTAKQATFEFLDRIGSGSIITGNGLREQVQLVTGEYHFAATTLRYMREWRRATGRKVVCTNSLKSMYRVV